MLDLDGYYLPLKCDFLVAFAYVPNSIDVVNVVAFSW